MLTKVIFPDEVYPLHSRCADPFGFPKCGTLDSIIWGGERTLLGETRRLLSFRQRRQCAELWSMLYHVYVCWGDVCFDCILGSGEG